MGNFPNSEGVLGLDWAVGLAVSTERELPVVERYGLRILFVECDVDFFCAAWIRCTQVGQFSNGLFGVDGVSEFIFPVGNNVEPVRVDYPESGPLVFAGKDTESTRATTKAQVISRVRVDTVTFDPAPYVGL